jgi:hypothetical protein
VTGVGGIITVKSKYGDNYLWIRISTIIFLNINWLSCIEFGQLRKFVFV